MYYLDWKGTEKGYKGLKPGDMVRVYHSGGYHSETFAMEAIEPL